MAVPSVLGLIPVYFGGGGILVWGPQMLRLGKPTSIGKQADSRNTHTWRGDAMKKALSQQRSSESWSYARRIAPPLQKRVALRL
jgi:hypothetical protein